MLIWGGYLFFSLCFVYFFYYKNCGFCPSRFLVLRHGGRCFSALRFFEQALIANSFLLVMHPLCMCWRVYSKKYFSGFLNVFLDSSCAFSVSLCRFQSCFFLLISSFLALWLEKILDLIVVFGKIIEACFVVCHMIYPGEFSLCWWIMFLDVVWLDVSLMMYSSLRVWKLFCYYLLISGLHIWVLEDLRHFLGNITR